MQYYRCKCGKREAWSSMGHPSCQACEECGLTLATHPDGHRAPEPHEWEPDWKIDRKTGEKQNGRRCRRCMTRESLPNEDIPRAVVPSEEG